MSNYRNDIYFDMIPWCPYVAQRFQCPFSTLCAQEIEGFQRQKQGPPTAPPPGFTPHLSEVTPLAVDPGAIRHCVNKFSYIWLNNGQSFWAYLVYVGRTSASGWRYRGRRWVYFGIDLREIRSFNCY